MCKFASSELLPMWVRDQLPSQLKPLPQPPTCDLGHVLAKVDPATAYATKRGGGDAWSCDMCNSTMRRGDATFEAMYHCTRGCEFDACAHCMKPSTHAMAWRRMHRDS